MQWHKIVCPHCYKPAYTANTAKSIWECPYCRKQYTGSPAMQTQAGRYFVTCNSSALPIEIVH